MSKLTRIKVLYRRLSLQVFLRVLILEITSKLFFRQARYFFAQGGEDLYIMYLLNQYKNGFYIDIGSNEPITYSNTFKLYLHGWQGILVDGNEGLIAKARKIRKKDICIHGIVSNANRELTFHLAENSLMSSVDSEYVASLSSDRSKGSFTMKSITLNEIIERHIPAGQTIDLLSIDVEGHDFEVLQSIDLTVYRPRLIVVEDLGHFEKGFGNNIFCNYLQQYGYQFISSDKKNLYFIAADKQTASES